MAVLIDALYRNHKSNEVEILGKGWFIAKPKPRYPYYSLRNILMRIKDAWLVLRNKAIAAQFAEDYFKEKKGE